MDINNRKKFFLKISNLPPNYHDKAKKAPIPVKKDTIPPQTVTEKPNVTLGDRVLSNATADLNAGVKEDPNHKNNGPRIAEYFKYVGYPDFSSKGDGMEWCGAAVSCWLIEAGVPIQGRAGVVMLRQEFIKANKFVETKDLQESDLIPGNVVFFSRGTESYKGHVGILQSHKGMSKISTIEGNSGPAANEVALMDRNLSDVTGIGLVSKM